MLKKMPVTYCYVNSLFQEINCSQAPEQNLFLVNFYRKLLDIIIYVIKNFLYLKYLTCNKFFPNVKLLKTFESTDIKILLNFTIIKMEK